MNRRCSRSGCSQTAVATLTFAYPDSMAVVGPLALQAEPGSYDLCREHSDRLSVPRGWEVVRLADDPAVFGPGPDDLMALADLIRQVGLGETVAPTLEVSRRKGHLAVLADPQ